MAAPAGDRRRASARSRCRRSRPAPTPPISRPSRGSTSDGYVISGRKVWVANAEAADVAIVFAATQPGVRGRGVSAFLVPMDTPGHRRVTRVGLARRARARLHGPRARRRARRRRRAARRARATASASRCGRSTAAASRSPRRRSASARRRSTRRSPTRSAARRSASRSATSRRSSASSPTWRPSSRPRGCSRWQGRRRARPRSRAPSARSRDGQAPRVGSRAPRRRPAMQILASHGYRRGSIVERLFRDVRAAEIYQGTSEVQRMVIAEHIARAVHRPVQTVELQNVRRSPAPDRLSSVERRSLRLRRLQPSSCLAIVCSCRFDVPS